MAFNITRFATLEEAVQAILELIKGRGNFVGSVTLTANAAATVVSFENCSAASKVFLSPRTANAAAAVPTTYISAIAQGSFTITHANDAQVDKTFDFECVGG